MKSQFWKWLQGLLAVMISSAAGGVTVTIIDPTTFNLSTGLGKLGEVCLVLAIIHAALYLQHSPLPGVTTDTPQEPKP